MNIISEYVSIHPNAVSIRFAVASAEMLCLLQFQKMHATNITMCPYLEGAIHAWAHVHEWGNSSTEEQYNTCSHGSGVHGVLYVVLLAYVLVC